MPRTIRGVFTGVNWFLAVFTDPCVQVAHCDTDLAPLSMSWEAALTDELVKVLDPVAEALCDLVGPDQPIISLRDRLFWLLDKSRGDLGLKCSSLRLQGSGVVHHRGKLRSWKFINKFGPFDQFLERRPFAQYDGRLSDAHLPPLTITRVAACSRKQNHQGGDPLTGPIAQDL